MTALLIALSTAVVCLSVALWRSRQTVERQAEEIESLLAHSLELRGQAAELSTLAHEAQAQADTACRAEFVAMDIRHAALAMLEAEIEAHRATKRTLATTRAWVTRLRRNYE